MSPRTFASLASLSLVACGGPPPPARPAAAPDLDIPEYLLDLGAQRTLSMRAPEESSETLQDAVRAARGTERRDALRKLALAHLWESEKATLEKDATRHRKAALRAARDARGRSRDSARVAEMAFIELWTAWRGGRDGADALAERFVELEETGELAFFAWMIRGELALERGDFVQASEAYRYMLVHLEHPLYPFALYRTAHCYRGMGRGDDEKQALREVVDLGRKPGASESTKRVSAVAQSELGPAAPTQP